ncbi:MAG: PKD domain-containing protein [Verrucomicrobiota bacterium]
MKKKSASQSGIFNIRVVIAIALCSIGASFGFLSLAAPAPSSGTISPASPTLTYTDGPFVVSNPTGNAGDPICTVPMSCSDFGLTVNMAPGPNPDPTKQIRVTVNWPATAADFDVYLYAGSPPTGGPIGSSASSADPEVIILPAQSAVYTIRVVPFVPAGQSYTATVALENKPPAPPPGTVTAPRYQNYPPNPSNLAGADSAGEPSIGVDWNPNVPSLKNTTPPFRLNTGGVAFFTASLNEFRVNFDDCSSPAKNPWEDVTSPTTGVVTTDPIGFVDHQVPGESGIGLGRVFQSQLSGPTSITAFSDLDGNAGSWMPSQGSGTPAGVDHQTIGGGPYNNAAVPPPPPHPLYPHQVYYASQDVGTAFAARSDNGGLTFGAGVPMWNLTQCGGLHGHLKVGPDGTVYVPNRSCGSDTGVAVSRDNGLTWTVKTIPGSGAGGTDPSIGIGSDNTVYIGYQNNANIPHIAVSTNHGDTWHDVDVSGGIIQNAVFPEVVAGDGDRAAFGFLGTTTAGGYQGTNTFNGTWYFYVATTFDRGQTYTLVNASGNDPVQVGSICTAGTTCGPDRNLLDFNDLQMDAEGRVLAAYADGCVAPGCTASTAGAHSPPYNESRAALASVIRQSGGPRLLSAFDSQVSCTGSPPNCVAALPGAPRVESVAVSGAVVHLVWSEPDNGGSPLTGYNIYRKDNVANTYALIATETQNCPACKTTYDDVTATGGLQYTYKVTARNSVGEGTNCGEFPVGTGPLENPCLLPGITIATDQAGDIITPIGQTSNGGWDLRSLNIAEPFAFASPDKIVFTLKVQDLTAVPANTRWPIQFLINGDTTTGYWVDMSTYPTDGGTPAAPVFKYGTFAPTGGTGGAYGAPNTRLGNADPASHFSADGTITIVIPRSALGNSPVGAHLTGFLVRVRFGSDAAAVTPDNMPDSLAPSGDYTVVGNASCAPNAAPIASLTANPLSGDPPLLVNFNASQSTDPNPGDTLMYQFDFGDPAMPGPQPYQSSPLISHTYQSNGHFHATLRVRDNRGLVSSNVAGVEIEVEQPLDRVVSNKVHGAAGPFDVVLFDPAIYPNGTGEIECRNEGTAPNGYKIIYTFGSEFAVSGPASSTPTITNGGTVSSHGPGPGTNQYTVTLTGVTNAQHHLVTLNGVPVTNSNQGNAPATLNNVVAALDLLIGDTSDNGSVNSSDISQTKGQTGTAVSAGNFRTDVTANGAINSSDISLVKAKSGTALPTDKTEEKR